MWNWQQPLQSKGGIKKKDFRKNTQVRAGGSLTAACIVLHEPCASTSLCVYSDPSHWGCRTSGPGLHATHRPAGCVRAGAGVHMLKLNLLQPAVGGAAATARGGHHAGRQGVRRLPKVLLQLRRERQVSRIGIGSFIDRLPAGLLQLRRVQQVHAAIGKNLCHCSLCHVCRPHCPQDADKE